MRMLPFRSFKLLTHNTAILKGSVRVRHAPLLPNTYPVCSFQSGGHMELPASLVARESKFLMVASSPFLPVKARSTGIASSAWIKRLSRMSFFHARRPCILKWWSWRESNPRARNFSRQTFTSVVTFLGQRTGTRGCLVKGTFPPG